MADIEDRDNSESVMLSILEESSGSSSGSEDESDVETQTIRGSPAAVSIFPRIQFTPKMNATVGGVLS